MSTRGTIIFIGANNYNGTGTKAVRLYQHCDTYPTAMLPLLLDTLRAVRKKSADHWQHISYLHTNQDFDWTACSIHAELLTGCFIAAGTTGFGMAAELENSIYLESHIPGEWDHETWGKVFGNHGDLEWVYVVNAIDRSIKVYDGGYTDTIPGVSVTRGTVDPLMEIESLKESYQAQAAARIKSVTRSLSRIGFPVNPKRESGRRAAHAAQRSRFRQK
jgi:hypothetical protein